MNLIIRTTTIAVTTRQLDILLLTIRPDSKFQIRNFNSLRSIHPDHLSNPLPANRTDVAFRRAFPAAAHVSARIQAAVQLPLEADLANVAGRRALLFGLGSTWRRRRIGLG